MSSSRLAFALFGTVCFLAGCLAASRYHNEKPRFRPGLPESCLKDPDTRPCMRAVAFRWYYDKFSDSCKVFPYRGCQSNGNNFKTKDDCINRCIKQIEPPRSWHPRADRLDEIYGEPVAKPSVHQRHPYFEEADNGMGGPEKRPDNGMGGPEKRPELPQRRRRPPPSPYMYRPRVEGRRQRPVPVTVTTVTTQSRPEARHLNQGQRPQERQTVTETHVDGDNQREHSFVAETEVVHDTRSESHAPPEEMPRPHMFPPRNSEDPSQSDDDHDDGVDDDFDIDADLDFDDDDDTKEHSDDPEDDDHDDGDKDDDHDGDDDVIDPDNEVEDPEEQPESSGPCEHHPETGPCKAYIRRWYFDSRQEQCVSFIYGGCRGNANNFPTKEDCLRSCNPSDKAGEQPKSPAVTNSKNEKAAPETPPGPKSGPEAKPQVDETPHHKEAVHDKSPEAPETSAEEPAPARDGNPDFSREVDDDVGSSSREDKSDENDRSGSRSEGSSEVSGSDEDRSGEEHTNDIDEDDHRGPLTPDSSEDDGPGLHNTDHSRPVLKRPTLFTSPLSLFSYYLNRLKPSRPLAIIRKQREREPELKKGTTFMRIFLTNADNKNRNDIGAMSPLSSRSFPPRRIVFGNLNMMPSYKRPSQRNEYRPPVSRWPNPMRMEKMPRQSMEPFGPYRRPQYHNPATSSSSRGRPQYSDRPQRPFFIHSEASYNRPYPQQRPVEEHARRKPMGKNMICLERVDVGNCHGRMPVPHWYYDPMTGSCDVFYYSGCSGNNNRFKTLEDCRSICMDRFPRPMPRERPMEREERVNQRVPSRPAVPEVAATELIRPGQEEVQPPHKAEPQVHEKIDTKAPEPVVHTIEFAHMHLDNRMEYGLVLAIMVLGGLALLVLISLTVYFMYKKHKLRTRPKKETTVQAVVRAQAYPEVHKISVVELPVELAGIHNMALNGQL